MHWIDWIIVVVPLLFVFGIAIYSKKYVHGVVDYLAAGRMAGRYVLTVGDMTAAFGIITLVGMVEMYYHGGFAIGFWQTLSIPIMAFISMTGFCLYRFRESKALSNGQFLEMRYSRSFRIVASFMRILSEMLTNAIGPAVAANFFIYFLGLPHKIIILGLSIPTFSLIVGLVLLLAVLIILPAGRISLLITDCIQGLFCYPVFAIIVVFIIVKFSWGNEIVPTLTNRVPGESFINPFDISKLKDFNLFATIVGIVSLVYNRASFAGNDVSSAGRTPHEQKMAGILGTWRMGFTLLLATMVALMIVTVMNHVNFAPKAHEIRQELSKKVAAEVSTSDQMRTRVDNSLGKIPILPHIAGQDPRLSQTQNIDTAYMDTVHKSIGDSPEENLIFQKFTSLYHQMLMPMGLRKLLPTGLLGIFCLMAIMLMLATDDGRIFNASSAIIQDMVVPFRKTRMTPQQHVKYVKVCTVFVALFFFACSLLFSQLDYINMVLILLCSIWLGAAGPIMVFGLYSRFGNTVGAYCALIFGSGTSVSGVLIQRNWADYVYPFLQNHGLVGYVREILETISGPFNPYVVWEMNAVKCPINSYEVYFLAMLFGTVAYIAGSLLTYRRPYNLERMLHRGKYNTDGVRNIRSAWTWRSVWGKLIGITPDYTRGDKIIVWLIFVYTFGYQIGLCVLLVIVWNCFQPWSDSWWSTFYFVNNFLIAPVACLITAVWFMWGGLIDIKQLFKDMAKRVDNPLDNGTVEGHVSVADILLFNKNKDT
jgi:Na+/proline symporter